MHLLCWKLHDVRDRRLNFFHSVVCSALIVSGWVRLAWCRKGLFGANWNHVHVWRSYRNFWMHLGEYLVHAWLISWQNWRNTLLLHTVGQLVWSTKYRTLFVYPTQDQTYTGWNDIRLWKLGHQRELVCITYWGKKKEATIALCGLSVKRLFLWFRTMSHLVGSSEHLNSFCSNRLLKNRVLEIWIQNFSTKCHFC